MELYARDEGLNAEVVYEGVGSATDGSLERLPHQLHDMASPRPLCTHPHACFSVGLGQA